MMSCLHHTSNHPHSCCSLGEQACAWPCAGASPYGAWQQRLYCTPPYFSHAGSDGGATLVIHKIVLEAFGNQSCTPRTFTLRITGPSYPCGELFTLRAGSCLTLDEPLVISGLEPGQYTIEEIFPVPHQYISTLTGPVCGNTVMVTASCAPTVVTLVNRRRLCSLCRRSVCGCC